MGNKQSEHLLPPDPFQQDFTPVYNPYGPNFYEFSPRRHRRHHQNIFNEPYRHRLGPAYGYGPGPLLPGYNLGYGGSPPIVNPPCGGQQCTAYENSSGNFESPVGVQCTCCSLGKNCRMNPPSGTKYNDCCSGLKCITGICMKK